MPFRKAEIEDFDVIKKIVIDTINEIFPLFYPKNIVAYYLDLNTDEILKEQINLGNFYLYIVDEEAIAAASINVNHIEKFYVLRKYQNKGYGNKFMDYLESQVSKNYDSVTSIVTSSSYGMHDRRGYKIIENKKIRLKTGEILAFQLAKKELKIPLMKGINLNNRTFKISANTKNGHVSNDTYFYFTQEKNMIKATYSGGDIKEGLYLGIIDDSGKLSYRYEHLTKDSKLTSGKCEAEIEISDRGKIIIYEKWFLFETNETGRSILVEE